MNDSKSISRFLLRTAIASIPLILLAAAYIILDPFKVVKTWYPYFDDTPWENRLGWNKNWVSVTAYEQGLEANRYDSFIFGSSISIAYRIEDWKKHLPDDAVPFHFDASDETVYGILKKIQYLDNRNDTIRHALIIFEPRTFRTRHRDDFLHYMPPQISGWYNYFPFHYSYFKDFLKLDFLKSYIPFLITGNPANYSEEDIFARQAFTYDKNTNEEQMDMMEAIIASNPDSFYTREDMTRITGMEPHYCEPLINDSIASCLKEIAVILNRHHCNYHIIFGPNRLKEIMPPADYAILNRTFSPERVYRYTSLDTVADDRRFYYDNGHYRVAVCDEILDSVYNRPSSNRSTP